MTIGFKRLSPHARLPVYAHASDAGMDVTAVTETLINPGARALVGTGLVAVIPEGYEIQVRPRSGLALKHGITVLNAPGTIDAGYRGEIGVILANFGSEPFKVAIGERIAQIVVAPVCKCDTVEVDAIEATDRGAGGFGSTGK